MDDALQLGFVLCELLLIFLKIALVFGYPFLVLRDLVIRQCFLDLHIVYLLLEFGVFWTDTSFDLLLRLRYAL